MLSRLLSIAAAFAAALSITASAAAVQDLEAVLVKDINSRPAGRAADPLWLTPLGSRMFFTAYTDLGVELWATEGTTESTYLVKDIAPLNSSTPFSLVPVGDTLFFAAYEGTRRELWKSDGTEAGTVRVKAIDPLTGLTAVGDLLFFVADDGEHGRELWKSDGSEAGTAMVADLTPGSGNTITRDLVDVDGTLFFTRRAGTSVSDYDLWQSDGTAAGTVPVVEFGASSSSNIIHLLNIDGVLYFVARVDNDPELWRHDTATGETVKIDVNPTGGSFPNELTDVGGTLFFSASVGFDTELWKLDGETPTRVRDINPSGHSTPNRFTAVAAGGVSSLFFFADDGVHGRELWKSDGTEAGTVMVADLNPTGDSSFLGCFACAGVPVAADVNGTLFFNAGLSHGGQFWKSDGTAAGTVQIEINPLGSAPVFFVNFNDTAFFIARDGEGQLTIDDFIGGYDLWKSDGTVEGTIEVEIATGRTISSFALPQRVIGSTLYFIANDKEVLPPVSDGDDIPTDYELWKTDGTEAGTVMVADINPEGRGFIVPGAFSFGELDGTLLFSANDGVTGRELWKSDGTEEGTELVKDLEPDDLGPIEELQGSFPSSFTTVGETAFFVATDNAAGRELWKTDGSEAGTVLVADINPGAGHSVPTNLIDFDGTLFFQASDGAAGRELWRSDGTTAGTEMVKDIQPGAGALFLSNFTVLGNTLFFRAGSALWKSDGSEAGTVQVVGVSSVGSLAALDGVLYFGAVGDGSGIELWRYDPVADVTELVADINPDGNSTPAETMAFAGALFFTADAGAEGRGLWKFDPATGIAEPIVDFDFPGDPNIDNLIVIGSTLYFTARTGGPIPRRGRWDLWKSDGTAAGTTRMDFDLGLSLSPQSLADVAGTLFFQGYRYDVGRELFKLVGTPSISITSPTDQAVVTEIYVLVDGLATDDGEVVSVVVNGVEAGIVSTGNPSDPAEVFFSAFVFLDGGENEITAVATDDDGNTTGVSIVVTNDEPGGSLPDCSAAEPNLMELWPPNHGLVAVGILGVTDAEGSTGIELEITLVTSDEPTNGPGAPHDPDALIVGDGTVLLRAERFGGGNGRVYEIHFTATNEGGECTGSVQVWVPHDQSGDLAVDDGQLHDATLAD